MKIEFKCKKCRNIFACDIGKVSISEEAFRPEFEKEIICPKCGKRSIDEILLTEAGQNHLTEAMLGFEDDDLSGDEDDDLSDDEDDNQEDYGFYEGTCQGCDDFLRLNDLGLCKDCAAKLDRDLIRERDWAYSESAFGVPESKLEELRNEVIKRYGAKLELIAPKDTSPKKLKNRKRNKKKKGKCR